MDASCGKCGGSSLTHDGKPWCATYGCPDDIPPRPSLGFMEWHNDPMTQKLSREKADLSVRVDRLQRRIASQRRRITRLIEIAKRHKSEK